MARTLLGWLAVLWLGTLGAGCADDLGPCDIGLARTLVYDDCAGEPSYEGQAILAVSCGSGLYCHSEDTRTPADRYGVPAGLNFDMALASIDRLARGQRNVVTWRHRIMAEIEADRMPPGAVGASRYETRQRNYPGLPLIGSPEGREAVRNWLSCRAPVVERTGSSRRGVVGAVEARGPVPPPVPTFSYIHRCVLKPGCGNSCHGRNDPLTLAENRLDLLELADAYTSLVGDPTVGVPAEGVSCMMGGQFRVVPGDPGASLLVDKLEGLPPAGALSCGNRMPLSGPVLELDQVANISQWITDGALDN